MEMPVVRLPLKFGISCIPVICFDEPCNTIQRPENLLLAHSELFNNAIQPEKHFAILSLYTTIHPLYKDTSWEREFICI